MTNIKSGSYEVSRRSNRFDFAFPKKWNCESISRDDVEGEAIEIDHKSTLHSKSVLNSRQWTGAKLHKFIRNNGAWFGEGWHFDSRSNTLCIWDKNSKESELPLGFVAFHYGLAKSNEENNNESCDAWGYVTLYLDLVFVRADVRGLGGAVAKHIATHFISYLADCAPHKLIGQEEEWSFYYHASYCSEGGERFSKLIEEKIEYIKEQRIWPGFNDILCEADW
jgi:hypothetical protein